MIFGPIVALLAIVTAAKAAATSAVRATRRSPLYWPLSYSVAHRQRLGENHLAQRWASARRQAQGRAT